MNIFFVSALTSLSNIKKGFPLLESSFGAVVVNVYDAHTSYESKYYQNLSFSRKTLQYASEAN